MTALHSLSPKTASEHTHVCSENLPPKIHHRTFHGCFPPRLPQLLPKHTRETSMSSPATVVVSPKTCSCLLMLRLASLLPQKAGSGQCHGCVARPRRIFIKMQIQYTAWKCVLRDVCLLELSVDMFNRVQRPFPVHPKDRFVGNMLFLVRSFQNSHIIGPRLRLS